MREPRNQTWLCETVNVRTPPSPWPRQMGKLNCCGPTPLPMPSCRSWNTREAPCWLKSLQKWGRGRDWCFSPPCCPVLQPGRSQQAQEPGKQSLCTKALLFWGPRACKGPKGERPGPGPTCMGNFHWMSKNTSNSGAFVLHQHSSFHINSGGARLT